MSVAFTPVDSLVEALAEKKIDLSGSALTVALTNTAHTAAWDTLSDLTQISYTNLSARVITASSSAQTAGDYTLKLTDLTLTASGAVEPFRYIYIYDDDATNDNLIGYYDYGSEVNMVSGDTFKIDFDETNGVLTLNII
jgi:hypothetical protein